MSQRKHLFAFSLLTILFTNSCGNNEQDNDKIQQQINEEAYRTRFNREATPEEDTGIKFSKSTETKSFLQQSPNWKMVLMAGDDSIKAFDNARNKVFELFKSFGVKEGIQLSRSSQQQVNGVRPTSIPNLEKAAKELNIKDGDACLFFLTSHGKPTGFYIRGQDYLVPDKLDQIVRGACGNRPTVLLVSACYAGIFAEPKMEAPNRIILAAARKDKTSFGCSAEANYTYWDDCLITNLPVAKTWLELAGKVEKCIEAKEAKGGFARSYPQARFGANVKDLEIKQ